MPSAATASRQISRLIFLVGLFALVLGAPSPGRAECTDYANSTFRAGDLQASGSYYGIEYRDQIAYVVNEGGSLQIFDMSDHNFPVLLGSLYLGFNLCKISVSGNIAAISGMGTPLTLVDVADPALPQMLGAWGDSSQNGLDLLIVENMVYLFEYIEDGGSHFRIIDISDPSHPVEMSSLGLFSEWIRTIRVQGSYAYLCQDTSGLLIIDISDPAAPFLAKAYKGDLYNVQDVVVKGYLGYVVGKSAIWPYDMTVSILDISDPTDPFEIGNFANDYSSSSFIEVLGSTCYYASSDKLTLVLDCSDPTNPQQTGHLPYIGQMRDMALFDNYLFEGIRNFGYGITYIAGPESNEPLSTLPTGGSSQSVVVSAERDGLAYLADGEGGLKVIDVSNPLLPVLLHTVSTPGFASDVAVSGNYAYVADGAAGLQVVDITDAQTTLPIIVGTKELPGTAVDVSVVSTTAFLAVSEAGLRVVNASDPTTPEITGVQDTLTMCQSVDVVGNYAYVADGVAGLKVLDVSDPDNPWIVGGVKGRSWSDATSVEVHGATAYVSDLGTGLHIVDVSVPQALNEVGEFNTTGEAVHVAVSGTYAYLADSSSGMQVLDVADSANPALVGNMGFDDRALNTFVTGEFVYVTTADGNLQICPGQCQVSEIVEAEFSTSAGPDLFYPAVVFFNNESTGYFQNCYWDFGDGIGTSTYENPSYYYARPGDYSVSLTVTGSGNSHTTTHLIRILADEPIISSVTDVPGDQGGFVFVKFVRSGHDDSSPGRSEMYTIQRLFEEEWSTVATSGAYGDHTYSVIAGTQGDGFANWNTPFRVIAHMDEGIWIGPSLSGFSVDNIAPAVPQGLNWNSEQEMEWDAVPDADFAYFQVYGSANGSFAEASPLGATTGTSLAVPLDQYPWFFVTAVDHYGNHSGPAGLGNTSDVPLVIKKVQLSDPVPNPFNPATTIGFSLPRAELARLTVYDLAGRHIRTLLDEVLGPGVHHRQWQGDDKVGHGVSAGTYFYRLEVGEVVITKRMMLLK